MTTQENATQTPKAEPAAVKVPKSYTARVVSGQAEILVTAYATKAGFQVAATQYSEPSTKGKKRVGTRGASSTAPTLEAAKAAVEKIVAGLVKNGWTRSERKAFGGFQRAADKFDLQHLPKAPGAKK